jgi:hypothetical protein
MEAVGVGAKVIQSYHCNTAIGEDSLRDRVRFQRAATMYFISVSYQRSEDNSHIIQQFQGTA